VLQSHARHQYLGHWPKELRLSDQNTRARPWQPPQPYPVLRPVDQVRTGRSLHLFHRSFAPCPQQPYMPCRFKAASHASATRTMLTMLSVRSASRHVFTRRLSPAFATWLHMAAVVMVPGGAGGRSAWHPSVLCLGCTACEGDGRWEPTGRTGTARRRNYPQQVPTPFMQPCSNPTPSPKRWDTAVLPPEHPSYRLVLAIAAVAH